MVAILVSNHLLLSLTAWLLGGALGGLLGYAIAVLLERLFATRPGWRRPSLLVPWRALIMGLLLLAWSPLIAIRLGLGFVSALASVALFVFLLAVPLTARAFLEHGQPSTLYARLIAGARTLLMASMFAAIAAGLFTGVGFGAFMAQHLNLMQFDLVTNAWLAILTIALLIDFLLGIPHTILTRRHSDEKSPPPTAT